MKYSINREKIQLPRAAVDSAERVNSLVDIWQVMTSNTFAKWIFLKRNSSKKLSQFYIISCCSLWKKKIKKAFSSQQNRLRCWQGNIYLDDGGNILLVLREQTTWRIHLLRKKLSVAHYQNLVNNLSWVEWFFPNFLWLFENTLSFGVFHVKPFHSPNLDVIQNV